MIAEQDNEQGKQIVRVKRTSAPSSAEQGRGELSADGGGTGVMQSKTSLTRKQASILAVIMDPANMDKTNVRKAELLILFDIFPGNIVTVKTVSNYPEFSVSVSTCLFVHFPELIVHAFSNAQYNVGALQHT